MKTHAEWVEEVARLLSQREGCGIMVLLEGPHGLELLTNIENPSFHFGILDCAKLTVGTRYGEQIKANLGSPQQKAYESGAIEIMQGKKVWGN